MHTCITIMALPHIPKSKCRCPCFSPTTHSTSSHGEEDPTQGGTRDTIYTNAYCIYLGKYIQFESMWWYWGLEYMLGEESKDVVQWWANAPQTLIDSNFPLMWPFKYSNSNCYWSTFSFKCTTYIFSHVFVIVPVTPASNCLFLLQDCGTWSLLFIIIIYQVFFSSFLFLTLFYTLVVLFHFYLFIYCYSKERKRYMSGFLYMRVMLKSIYT